MKAILKVIWDDHLDEFEFEAKWNSVINNFGMNNNKWLSDMFNLRANWIPAYSKNITMGGLLRTTQRSESENSFYGKYLNSHMTLVEFYIGFNGALDAQRYNRVKSQQEARGSTPNMNSKISIEQHGAEVFTLPIFKEFQLELLAAAYRCCNRIISEDVGVSIYVVRDALLDNRDFKVNCLYVLYM